MPPATIRWDAATSQVGGKTVVAPGDQAAELSPDGSRVAAFDGSKVVVRDAVTGRPERELPIAANEFGGIVSFAPDGGSLAVLTYLGRATGSDRFRPLEPYRIVVHDLSTGAARLPIDCPGYAARLAFSPDGRRLAGTFRRADSASQFRPGEVRVWDAATGQLLLAIPAHDHAGWQLTFSPDGGRLATTGQVLTATGDFPAGGEVKVWDAATGRLLARFQGHAGPISVIAFSPDGRRLATGGGGNRIKLWDADTGQELLSFPSGEGDRPLERPSALTFRPDGRAVAAAVGKAVYIWEAATDDGPP